MQRLSLLTFSRGYVDRVFSMIEDLYDVVDEIVLIDSSDKEERKKLHAMKKKRRWSKLKIVYIVPLGFVELYRPYGLSLCKNDWVLPLYADERISDLFKADINNIINNTKCSAFNIVRYENVEKGEGRSNFFTFQIQLIRKSKVRYKGLVDERPEVDGELCTLDSSKYYVRHITELMRHESNEYYKRGSKFREFEGISYHEYNERLLEHLSRLRGEGIEKTRGTLSGRALHKMILAYERMMRKRPEQEISDFDLFFFIMIKGFAVSAKAKSIRGFFGSVPHAYEHTKEIAEIKRQPDHDTSFKISRVINRIGMVRFLGLDDEASIRALNKKYTDNKEGLAGLSLLAHLLKQKYKEMQSR